MSVSGDYQRGTSPVFPMQGSTVKAKTTNESDPSEQLEVQKTKTLVEQLVAFNDTQFLCALLELAKSEHPNLNIKKLLKNPFVQRRFCNLATESIDNQLKLLLSFLKNNHNLQDKQIKKWVAKQLVRIEASLSLLKLCKQSIRHYKSEDCAMQLEAIVHSSSLPKSIQAPLKGIISLFNDKPLHSFSTVLQRGEFYGGNYISGGASYETKNLAVNVGYWIDGSDFQDRGIRLWIHQPSRYLNEGKDETISIIIKQIEEFQSGRRNFIFETTSAPAPIENYKTVMLYIIRCLKEDRPQYYCQVKLDLTQLEKLEAEYQSKGEIDSTWNSLYRFELVARQLISLENQVNQANSFQEISQILHQFQKIYFHLPNLTSELTVCSSICSSVLSLSWGYKPVLHYGVPHGLLALSQHLGISGNVSQEVALASLATLTDAVRCHPREIQERFDRLEKIYEDLENDPTNHPLMEEFLKLWESIPNHDFLLTRESPVHEKAKLKFQKFINSLEGHFGLSHQSYKELWLFWQRCTSYFLLREPTPMEKEIENLFKTYKEHQFTPTTLENNLKVLEKLKGEIDLFKQKHSEEINRKNFWVAKFSNELDRVLSERNLPFNFEENFVPIHVLKRHAQNTIVLPLPEIGRRYAKFRGMLSANQGAQSISSFTYLKEVTESLLSLKGYLVNEAIFAPALSPSSYPAICAAMRQLEKFEADLAAALVHLEEKTPEVYQLISRLALSQGLLEEEHSDLESLQIALEKESCERIIGYKTLRAQVINTPYFLQLLDSRGHSIDEAIQIVQGGLCSGLTMTLDSLLPENAAEESLGGKPLQHCEIIGKIRIVREERNFAPALPGEILVVENAAPEVHHYLKAAAVICRQGGAFSHAAITFRELQIPALLGCDIDALKKLDGQYVHLNLSAKSTVNLVSQEVAQLVEKMDEPTVEVAALIEQQPVEIREVLQKQFYKAVFRLSSAEKILPFFAFAYAESYFNQERDEVKKLEKQLWKAESDVQKACLMNKIHKKITLLCQIAKKWKPELAEELNQQYLQIKMNSASIASLQSSFLVSSGKKENLGRLQEFLKSNPATTLKLSVPDYTSNDAEKLLWSRYPKVKQEILSLLESSLSRLEKSEKICECIFQIPLEEAAVSEMRFEGDCIVRSSAALEDQAGSAAAGIFESIPVRDGELFAPAFLKVLASAFSERALAFYEVQGVSSDKILEMGWISQKYVSNGKYSGVAFSVTEESKWDEAGIQVVHGLGGGVDGTQRPVHITVDSKTGTLSDLRISKGEKLPIEIPVALEIASLMKKMEEYFHAPVEIEFVGIGDEIAIVQLRSIT